MAGDAEVLATTSWGCDKTVPFLCNDMQYLRELVTSECKYIV
jgi:hypothetical protein